MTKPKTSTLKLETISEEAILSVLDRAAARRDWSAITSLTGKIREARTTRAAARVDLSMFTTKPGQTTTQAQPQEPDETQSVQWVRLRPSKTEDPLRAANLDLPRAVWTAAVQLAGQNGYEMGFSDLRAADSKIFAQALRRGMARLAPDHRHRAKFQKIAALAEEGTGIAVSYRCPPAV